mmetsp:Transcript_70459/g.125414  ORF Transcript_70459/g.125414 Transcript_70459/m.125414 type:complete len:302 (+) Transcript_70459:292-1197(+)
MTLDADILRTREFPSICLSLNEVEATVSASSILTWCRARDGARTSTCLSLKEMEATVSPSSALHTWSLLSKKVVFSTNSSCGTTCCLCCDADVALRSHRNFIYRRSQKSLGQVRKLSISCRPTSDELWTDSCARDCATDIDSSTDRVTAEMAAQSEVSIDALECVPDSTCSKNIPRSLAVTMSEGEFVCLLTGAAALDSCASEKCDWRLARTDSAVQGRSSSCTAACPACPDSSDSTYRGDSASPKGCDFSSDSAWIGDRLLVTCRLWSRSWRRVKASLLASRPLCALWMRNAAAVSDMPF